MIAQAARAAQVDRVARETAALRTEMDKANGSVTEQEAAFKDLLDTRSEKERQQHGKGGKELLGECNSTMGVFLDTRLYRPFSGEAAGALGRLKKLKAELLTNFGSFEGRTTC